MAQSNFVDYIKIFCKSGNGGAGSAHFRREKFVPKGGPDGGDGGRGGHVILRGNAQMWTLLHLRYTRHIKAEHGEPGGRQRSTGASGTDAIIEVPLGSVAKHAETGEIICEITEDKQEVIIMKGGSGYRISGVKLDPSKSRRVWTAVLSERDRKEIAHILGYGK